MAAPFPILEMNTAERQVVVPLAGSTFAYTYRQSIYGAPVREELALVGDAIRIERALSTDVRALEYFRWPGEADEVGGGMLSWRAPDNAPRPLHILVVAEGEQAIDTGARRVTLWAEFGDGASVIIRGSRRPLLLWLWGLLPWA